MKFKHLVLISTVSILSVFTFAQDAHLALTPAKALIQHSSWAHGYLHGYEAGFHAGNLDLHMLRPTRDPHTVKEYKQAGNSYRSQFGSASEFKNGYGSGFEVGYLDGAQGREFRAVKEADEISQELDFNALSNNEGHFDMMLAGGYQAGRRSGLNDARAKANFGEAKGTCPAGTKDSACGAYLVGFRWGYSDGFTNQRTDSATQRASR